MNQMLINASTPKFQRSVRPPEGGVPAPKGGRPVEIGGLLAFCRAVGGAAQGMDSGAIFPGLDLLVIQIDGIHMDEHMTLVAAVGVDANGDKHPPGAVGGGTENGATARALIDNLVSAGWMPVHHRRLEGSSKAIRATFGRHAAILRRQIHKARNIMDRLP
jgi:hypothetical protein